MHLKKSIIVALLISIMVSCKDKTPEGILSPKEMEDVLVDIHIANGLYNSKYDLKLNYDNFDDDLYLSVLKKHQVSDSTVVESMFYYSEQPELLNQIYSQVMNDLKVRNESIINKIKEMPDSVKNEIDMGIDEERELELTREVKQ
ncbi:DUF4296 domain-containing protein [Halosquirtibacter xylanolyticus]|uniref:DUF4296 domain-containing protein n=1 Tax=Halosquirtibacter xylanolyticus TaxID=3374599 RepID=UPI003749DE2E|nr:DUF4296 domain-containing protein [Prolixibacteraceae bacterium]